DTIVININTFKSGYVGVLTWLDQEFVTLWENYPWGLIESLFVLTDSGYPEWLVISSQKMVYGWRLQNGEVVLSRHFHAPYVGEKAFYIPGEGLLSFSAKRGTSLFKLERDSFLELWNIPGFAGAEAFYVNGEFLIRDENYNYFHLIPRSAGWEIYVGGRDVTDQIGTLQAGSLLYFNLEHLGPELGFSIENGRLVQGERFFELEAEKPLVKVDGLPIPLKHPLLLADNDFYAPLDLFSLLGWSPAVDQARQRIEFNKSWGWWF
ncbi:MAG TPA: hypothetical protein GX528_07970, partial [Firmicutes bacterium]|nr:hypothetical protein [Bacillota bacterium]